MTFTRKYAPARHARADAQMLTVLREILAAIVAASAPRATMIGRRELAQLLDVSAKTIDTWRATGALGPQPASIGGSLRWHRHEVEAWMANRTVKNQLHDAKAWPAVWRRLSGATRPNNQ